MSGVRSTVVFLVFAFTAALRCTSQIDGKPVYRRFIQRDSAAINNSAVMVLYTDNSFINYGILKDLQNQEVYVWYTFGKWSQKDSELTCRSYFEQFNQKKVIDEIKLSYKKRIDYRLIESYYEFVNERYADSPFIIIKNKLLDKNKKIEYVEVKTDTTITN